MEGSLKARGSQMKISNFYANEFPKGKENEQRKYWKRVWRASSRFMNGTNLESRSPMNLEDNCNAS